MQPMPTMSSDVREVNRVAMSDAQRALVNGHPIVVKGGRMTGFPNILIVYPHLSPTPPAV